MPKPEEWASELRFRAEGPILTGMMSPELARAREAATVTKQHIVSSLAAGTGNTYYRYDALDNLLGVCQGGPFNAQGICTGSKPRYFTYDALKRLATANNPESGPTSYTYDANGNLIQKTDARPVVTCYGSFNLPGTCDHAGYDKLNRVIRKNYNDGTPAIDYRYDDPAVANSRGRLTQVDNGVSVARYSSYDALGRLLTSSQTPGGGSPYGFSYTYNRAGGLEQVTYPSGRHVTSCYDAAGRLNVVKDGLPSSPNAYATANAYWPHGAIQTLTLGNGVVESSSYNQDRLQPYLISAAKNGTALLNLGYSYCSSVTPGQSGSCTNNNGNVAGALTSMTYPSGRALSLAYDTAGRTAALNKPAGGSYVSGIQYTPHGAIQQMTLGNGVVETMQFNARLQPTCFAAAKSPTTLLSLTLTYTTQNSGCDASGSDNNGNLLGQTISGTGGSFSQSYGYDGFNRLTSASEGSNWSRALSYDAYGNMWVTSGTGVPIDSFTPTTSSWYNAQNRLVNTGLGIAYDGVGNQTAIGVNGYAWTYDGENRLKTSTLGGGAATTYSYDGDGRRVKKVQGSATTTYVYDAMGQLAAEYATQAETTPCTTCYLTVDHLGSTRLVTEGSAGQPVKRYDYMPFGEEIYSGVGGRTMQMGYSPPVSDNFNPKFTSKERDGESGLDYFGFRSMSTAQGRFTTVDPAMASAILDDPQTWNRYAYVNNRPLTQVDPDGLVPVPVVAGGIGAGTAFVGSAASQYLVTGHVDWKRAGIAAAGGFVSGATFGPVGGWVARTIASNPWVASAVAGVVSNVAGTATNRAGDGLYDGSDLAGALDSAVDQEAMESAAGYGLGGGLLAAGAGQFWRVLNKPYLPRRPSPTAHSATSVAAKAANASATQALNSRSTGPGNSVSTWFGAFFTNVFAPLRRAEPKACVEIYDSATGTRSKECH